MLQGNMEKRNKMTSTLKESVLGKFYVIIHTAWQVNVELLY